MAVEHDSTGGLETGAGVEAGTGTASASVPDGGAGSPSLSRDDAFDLLSNRRRRYVLHFLKQRNGGYAELRELSAQVAAWENRRSVEGITSTERRRVYTSLQQFHLPKLHENGVVTYDDRGGVVELTAGADDLDVYLDVVAGREIPWSLYYVGLSALGIVSTTAVWIGVYPMTVLPDVAWGVAIAVAFGISALVHAHRDRQTRLGVAGPPPELRES